MKPEAKVELILWDWLRANNTEIFFNRINQAKCETFQTRGINKKPDLIFSFISYGKKYYVAVEVKDGNSYSNLADANKILYLYYHNYLLGKTEYLINGKKIKLDFFIIATQYSKLGRLLKTDNKVIDNIDKGQDPSWKKMSFNSKTLPRAEFQRTRDFLRNLWRDFAAYRKLNQVKIAPALGILVSDTLKDIHPIDLKLGVRKEGKPMLLTIRYNDWASKKSWRQNFIGV